MPWSALEQRLDGVSSRFFQAPQDPPGIGAALFQGLADLPAGADAVLGLGDDVAGQPRREVIDAGHDLALSGRDVWGDGVDGAQEGRLIHSEAVTLVGKEFLVGGAAVFLHPQHDQVAGVGQAYQLPVELVDRPALFEVVGDRIVPGLVTAHRKGRSKARTCSTTR